MELGEEDFIAHVYIRLKFTKLTEMNAYIYGGRSRKTAYENITLQNVPAQLAVTYNISAYRGLVVVAYPNKDKSTEFAFDYWVEVMPPPKKEEEKVPAHWSEFEGDFGEQIY